MNPESENQLAVVKVAKRKLWPEIKRAYLAGEGSYRELAERFCVSPNTLEKRAAREGWRREMAALCGKVTAAAEKVAEEKGKALGLTAASLVERQIRETEAWLNRIEAVAGETNNCTLEPRELQQLVSSWRTVIDTAREAFRLDEDDKESPIHVGFIGQLNVTQLWGPPEPAPARAIDVASTVRPETNPEQKPAIDAQSEKVEKAPPEQGGS